MFYNTTWTAVLVRTGMQYAQQNGLCFIDRHHFHVQAHVVGACTPSGRVNKPWSPGLPLFIIRCAYLHGYRALDE